MGENQTDIETKEEREKDLSFGNSIKFFFLNKNKWIVELP